MGSSRPSSVSRLMALAVVALAPACATGAYGENFGATSGDFTNSGSSGALTTGSDNGGSGSFGSGTSGSAATGSATAGSANTGSSGGASGASVSGATGSSGGGDDASSGADVTGPDSSSGAGDAGQTESGGPPYVGLSVLYKVEIATPTGAYLGCQLSIKNSGTGSPALSALKVRYYFTDEVRLPPKMNINWSHISTSGADINDLTVTSTFVPIMPMRPGADTYIEFSFASGHTMLGPNESAVFSWQMQGPDPAKNLYTQTNDYSFDSTKTSLTSWDRIGLLQNGTPVWGRVP